MLVELREIIDEDYCFKNGIEYNLGAICGSPIEILDLAIRFVKKTQEKEKEQSILTILYFLAVAKLYTLPNFSLYLLYGLVNPFKAFATNSGLT